MQPRSHRPGQHNPAAGIPATMYHHRVEAEASLRHAARLLEYCGVTDDESARLARIVFRLAQRVGVDAGRLEAAA